MIGRRETSYLTYLSGWWIRENDRTDAVYSDCLMANRAVIGVGS